MSEERKENGMINFGVDFKESYWEEIKQDPSRLGELITRVTDGATGLHEFAKHGKSRAVGTDFRFVDREGMDRLLEFQFEVYDVSDEEEEKKYMEKLSPEDREIYEKVYKNALED